MSQGPNWKRVKKNCNSYHRCEVMTTSLVLGAAKQLRGLPGLDRGSPLLKGKRLRGRSATKFYTFLGFDAVSPLPEQKRDSNKFLPGSSMRAEMLTSSRTRLALLPAARTALWAGRKSWGGSGAGGRRVVIKHGHGVRTTPDREQLIQIQAGKIQESEILF